MVVVETAPCDGLIRTRLGDGVLVELIDDFNWTVIVGANTFPFFVQKHYRGPSLGSFEICGVEHTNPLLSSRTVVPRVASLDCRHPAGFNRGNIIRCALTNDELTTASAQGLSPESFDATALVQA